MGDTMENHDGLDRILADIQKKTGVCARLAPGGGEETALALDWNGERVTLYFAGKDESAAREAKLVAYLLSETSGGGDGIRAVLRGDGGRMQAFRYLARHNIPDAPCFAAEILPDRREKDAFEHVERCLDGNDCAVFLEEGRIAAVKFTEEGQTPFDFGCFICRSLYEEAGIRAKVGVGCEMPSFGEIAVSYAQAVSALRMSDMLGDKGDVHAYSEYLLVQMLSDVPKERVKECLASFRIDGTEEVFRDEELFSTAEVFLERDLNLSETSRTLFIHRNTLSYRLDKIERLTGLNIRKFSDAVTFRVITVLLRLIKE